MSEHGPAEQWGSAYGGAPGYDAGHGYGTGHPVPAYGQQYGQQYGDPYAQQYAQPYGQQYGQAYGQYPHGYGAPPPWAAPLPWPHGPGRPGVATAAAVLGFVTAGLTALASLGFLIALLTGESDATVGVLALGLPCAAGQVYGSVRLLARRSPVPLFASSLAAVGVLLLALVVAAVDLDGDDALGAAFFVVLAGVLPVLTAVYARLPATLGWTGSAPPA